MPADFVVAIRPTSQNVSEELTLPRSSANRRLRVELDCSRVGRAMKRQPRNAVREAVLPDHHYPLRPQMPGARRAFHIGTQSGQM